MCTHSAPKTRAELKAAVDTCLRASSVGKCPKALGPIGEWDVSRVTDMNNMFYSAQSFNADISKWNVSSVTNMQSMFNNARSFNADISEWDVSNVTNMQYMFYDAGSFSRTLCGAWKTSKTYKNMMFDYSRYRPSGRLC